MRHGPELRRRQADIERSLQRALQLRRGHALHLFPEARARSGGGGRGGRAHFMHSRSLETSEPPRIPAKMSLKGTLLFTRYYRFFYTGRTTEIRRDLIYWILKRRIYIPQSTRLQAKRAVVQYNFCFFPQDPQKLRFRPQLLVEPSIAPNPNRSQSVLSDTISRLN